MWSNPPVHIIGSLIMQLGNLRTTTKFTTTTSVDWEKTGTRTSVWAGKRKLRMQSVGRSCKTVMFGRNRVFSQWRLLKQCKILSFKLYV